MHHTTSLCEGMVALPFVSHLENRQAASFYSLFYHFVLFLEVMPNEFR